MGNQAQAKDIRQQIRKIAKEDYQHALTAESMYELDKRMTAFAAERLDAIEKAVDRQIKVMDNRTTMILKSIMGDASGQISRELFNINCSLLAWQRVLLRTSGRDDTEALEAEIKAEKEIVTKEVEAEALRQAEEQKKAEQEATNAKAAADLAAAKAYLDKSKVPSPESPQTSEAGDPQSPTPPPASEPITIEGEPQS